MKRKQLLQPPSGYVRAAGFDHIFVSPEQGLAWSAHCGRHVGSVGPYGYVWIGIPARRTTLHRLMLETFTGPCPPEMECRHLNGCRTDNRIVNLCWGTRKANVGDMIRHGTRVCFTKGRIPSATRKGTLLKAVEVRMIIYLRRTKLYTQQQIGAMFNVSRETVSSILTKQNWRHIWTA